MKRAFLILSITFFAATSFSQSIQNYFEQGIEAHDAGKFNEAVESYKKALKIDPKNELVNYEIALTYFSMQNYKMTIEHAETAVKAKGDNLVPAYILLGSALDNSGETEESIKLFKKAIKKTGGHYLLHYNLGLNYFKIKDRVNSEQSIVNAIEMNPDHATSHLVLGLIHDELGHKVQSTLAFYYFLLLEPDSKRSSTAVTALHESLGSNIEEDSEKPNTINISLSSTGDSEFMSAELMLSLLQASSSQLEENKGKTEDEMFVINTSSYFTTLGELRKKDNNGVWWDLYTEVFYEIAQSDHMETFCKYITQSKNDDSKEWLEENPEAVKAMIAWLKELNEG